MLNQLNMDWHQNKLRKNHQTKKQEKEFTEICDFHKLVKVKENKDRIQRHDLKKDSRKKRLRNPLEIGEKDIVLPECLKKKDAPGEFYKSSTENKTF